MHTDELVISEAPVPIHGSPIIPGSASNNSARSELLSSQEDSLNKSLDKPAAAPDNKHDDDKLELEQQQEEHKTTGTPAPAQDKPNKTCDACQILKGHENNAADTSVHTNVNANAASAVSVLKSIHSNTSATPSSPTVVQGQAQEGQNRDHNLNPSSSASASASAAPGSDSSPGRFIYLFRLISAIRTLMLFYYTHSSHHRFTLPLLLTSVSYICPFSSFAVERKQDQFSNTGTAVFSMGGCFFDVLSGPSSSLFVLDLGSHRATFFP